MISIHKDFDNPPEKLKSQKGWEEKSVRKELLDLYSGKCGYTERIPKRMDDLVVTHYRPIKDYDFLKNEWSNLLITTKQIRGFLRKNYKVLGKKISRKVDNFQVKADSALFKSEKPLLIHPEVDRPENHFSFNADGVMTHLTERGEYTINVLQLNIRTIVSERKKVIKEYSDLASSIAEKYIEVFLENKIPKDIWFITLKNNPEFVKEVYQFFDKLKIQAQEPTFEFSLLRRRISENPSLFLKVKKERSFIKKLIEDLYKEKNKFKETIKLKDNKVEDYTNQPEILPYRLLNLEIENYRGIKRLEINNLPSNAQWIFLTGENGFGKTSILQSIAIALVGTKDVSQLEDIENSFIKATIGQTSNLRINTIGDVGDFKYIPNTAFYGADRLTLGENYFLDSSYSFNKLNSIFSVGKNNLLNIEEFLIDLNFEDERKFEQIKNIILKITEPNLSDIIIDESSLKKKVYYIEKSPDSSSHKPVQFHNLAAGFRSIIAMIGDMIIQLVGNSINEQKEINIEGIVIMDEIDAHLHPKYQKQFVSTLRGLFPKVQFIVSTHSPIPLLGAPYNSVILNVNRESAREGISIKRLDNEIDFKRLTPEALLTSPIFGFREIIADALEENYSLLETESDYEKIMENDKVRKRIENLSEEDLKKLKEIMS